jgi:hypothetical protein
MNAITRRTFFSQAAAGCIKIAAALHGPAKPDQLVTRTIADFSADWSKQTTILRCLRLLSAPSLLRWTPKAAKSSARTSKAIVPWSSATSSTPWRKTCLKNLTFTSSWTITELQNQVDSKLADQTPSLPCPLHSHFCLMAEPGGTGSGANMREGRSDGDFAVWVFGISSTIGRILRGAVGRQVEARWRESAAGQVWINGVGGV